MTVVEKVGTQAEIIVFARVGTQVEIRVHSNNYTDGNVGHQIDPRKHFPIYQ